MQTRHRPFPRLLPVALRGCRLHLRPLVSESPVRPSLHRARVRYVDNPRFGGCIRAYAVDCAEWAAYLGHSRIPTGSHPRRKPIAALKTATVDRSHQAGTWPRDVANLFSLLLNSFADPGRGKAAFYNFTKWAFSPMRDCQMGVNCEYMYYNISPGAYADSEMVGARRPESPGRN